MAETSGVRAPLSTDGYGDDSQSEDLVTSPFERWERSFQEPDAPAEVSRDKVRKQRTADAPASGKPLASHVASDDRVPATGLAGTGETVAGLRQKEIARRKRQRELAEASRILNGTPEPSSGAEPVRKFTKAFDKRRGAGGRSRHAGAGSVSFLEEALPDQTDLLRRIRESEQRDRLTDRPDGHWHAEGHDPGVLLETGELRLEAAPLPFEIERAEVHARPFLSWRRVGISALVLVPGLVTVGLLLATDWRAPPVGSEAEPAELAESARAPVAPFEPPVQPGVPEIAPPTAALTGPLAGAPSVTDVAAGADGAKGTAPATAPGAATDEVALANVPGAAQSGPQTAGAGPEPAPETRAAIAPETSPAAVAEPIAAAPAALQRTGAPADVPAAIGATRAGAVQTAALADRAAARDLAASGVEPLAATTGVSAARRPALAVGEPVVVLDRIEGKEIAAIPTDGTNVVADAAATSAAPDPRPVALAVARPVALPVAEPMTAPLGAVPASGLRLRPVQGPAAPIDPAAVGAPEARIAAFVPEGRGPARSGAALTGTPAGIQAARVEAAAVVPGLAAAQPAVAPRGALVSGQPQTVAALAPEAIPFTVLPELDAPVRPLARAAVVPETVVLARLPGAETLTGQEAALAPGVQVILFAPGSVPGAEVDAMVERLSGSGFDLSDPSRVGFTISQSNIRYYHAQDAEVAAAVAQASGALLRDFTGSGSSAPPGTIELWLAGDGSGGGAVAAAKPAAKKAVAAKPATRKPAPTAVDRTARLKSQVINKLRSATSQ